MPLPLREWHFCALRALLFLSFRHSKDVRIPRYIVALACLITAILSWWIGIQQYDFLTPPNPEERYALTESLKARAESYDVFASAPALPPKKEEIVIVEPPAPPPPTRINLGDLEVAPGLDEYTAASQQGQDYLAKLADALEEQGYPERAMIAWERMLDSTPAPPTIHRTATTAITRLRPTVPFWTVDPSERIEIVLNIGATLSNISTLEAALELISNDIDEATAGILDVRPKLNLSEEEQGERILPIALWLNHESSPDASTSILTFTPELEDQVVMNKRVAATVYQLIRMELEETGSFLPLPTFATENNQRELLKSRITRLQWKTFAQALIRKGETIATPTDAEE